MKRIITLALALMLVLSLAACGGKEGGASKQPTDQNAPAHEHLMAEVNNLCATARQQADVGAVLQSEYVYGLAQAEVSSLRLALDTILWLKGEGDSLARVIGTAPYTTWDEIVGAGLASDAPAYYEGLLNTIQGKEAEAEVCYDRGKANPLYRERDLYYLKSMSVEELHALREQVAALETTVWQEYTPRTRLLSERTGAEFAPDYHLHMAGQYAGQSARAYQCAVNALLTNPTSPNLYAAAVCYAIDADEADAAQAYLNEGLWVFPEDGMLNYLAALTTYATGNADSAKAFLDTARNHADEALTAKINALASQIGG